MTRIATVMIALSVTAAWAPLAAHAEAAWKKYESAKGKFSVMMPGTPKEETVTHASSRGPITMHDSVLLLSDVLYTAAWAELPQGKGDPADMLAATRDAAAKSSEGKIMADKEIKLDGKHAGRAYKLTADAMDSWHRVYLVDKRLYHFTFSCRPTKCTDAQAARYLESFKLLAASK